MTQRSVNSATPITSQMTRRNIFCQMEAKLGICPVRILWGAVFPRPLPSPHYVPRSLHVTVLCSTPLTSVSVLVTQKLESDKCIQNFIRISFKWRSHLEKPKCRREDSNTIDLKETGLGVASYRCFQRGDEPADAIRA